MSVFDFLKRKPKSYAGPALPATDLTIEDVQRATTAPQSSAPAVAPSFAETKRAPQKITLLDTIGTQRSPASSQGSTVFTKKPDIIKPEKPDPFKDNFADVQGLIDDQTLASGSVPRIVEAVKAAQRTIAEEKYNPIDEKSSWLQRLWEPTKQALQTPGETLITQAQNIANYGLQPMGLTSRPLTRKGQLEALDRVLEKYAPEELVNSKLIRAMAGEQSAPMGAAEFTTNIGTAVVGSTAAINAFRSLPVAARLKSSGEAGIYATHFMENLIASAVASTPGSLGKKKPGDFHKLMITNGGFLFPTASYGGLAIATTASFLANMAMGQKGWEAAGNSLLGLAGAAVQRKQILGDLYTYRKGAFTDALRTIVRAEMGDDIPQPVRDAAIDEAAQLRAYYEQNPQDLDGLYKMTLESQTRLMKTFKEYKKASPTGEQRLIGRTGPTQNGPDGGFPEPAKIGNNKVAPVDMNKANDPGIQKHIELEQNLRPGSVKQALIPIDKIDVQIDESGGLHHITAKPGDQFPPPVAAYDPATGRFTMKDGDHRIAFFKDSGYNQVPMLVIDKGGSLPSDFNLPLPSSIPVTPESSLPSIFAKQPTAGPSTIPIAPRIAPSPADGPTWAEKLADQGADPNVAPRASGEDVAPSVVPQGTKPVPVPEARRLAVDLYRQLDSEYNPEFVSRAELGEEFADAELNAGLAAELVTNNQTKGVVQKMTGKQGYAALEGLELDDMGPFVTKLRASVENGTPQAVALDDIRARIRDGIDGEYGRMVLEQMISKSRGEVRKQPKRPNEEEILAVIDKAIADGRLQMTDEAGNGRTVEQVYERIYNELARKSDGTKLPSTPRRELLGDVLRREDMSRKLSKQQIYDAEQEAQLSNKDLNAMYRNDEQFESDLEKSRKMTQIEYNKTVAEAKELPPEISKKIIADLEKLKAAGKIATPLEARLQKNKFLTKLLTQQKGMTRAAQRTAVAARKDANNERMKSLYKTVPRMPVRIQNMMKDLHTGYRKTMPLAQQEEVVSQMKELNEIGAQQNRLFKEKREAADAELAKDVIETAVKKVKPQDKRVRDRVGALLMNETPPNLVIMDMGEGAMNVFKRSMDDGMNEAWPMQRDWDREVLAKTQEIGIKYEDMQAIVDYSLWNRGGKAGELARSRLSRMGVVDPKKPPTLTEKQKQFYEWQKKFLKVLATKTKEVFEKENPLRELDITDPNYFPMKVVGNDMTVAKGPNTMSIDQVPDGFTKNIKGNEELDIYREPDALFRHVNDVAHYVALTERMQQMRRILERKEVTAALGNENVDYLQNRWLDMVARHGQYAEKVNEAMAMINSMGNRAYGGVLAMKAIAGIRQFGSVIDATGPLLKMFGVGPTATYIAKVVKNTPAVISEHLTVLGDYIETNPDLQASVGLTDLVMEQVKGGEFSARHTFLERHPKLNKFVFAFIRQPDLLGRATLAMHVEGLYKAQGMNKVAPVDMKLADIEWAKKSAGGSLVEPQMVPIDKIDYTSGLRGSTDDPSASLSSGKKVPPPLLSYDRNTGRYTALDGSHRMTAFNKDSYELVPALVINNAGMEISGTELQKTIPAFMEKNKSALSDNPAQRLAMQLVNNVFGSMRVHNRPTASGHANTKPLYLLGQTQRARQGMYRQAMKDWTKDPIGNSAVLGSYTLSSMILMYLGSLVIEDKDNREKAQKQSIQWGWFYAAIENTLPVVGSMISRTLQTGDASNAVPYLGMVMNALGSYRQVVTGKKTETKIKGALRGTEQTLGAIGIPAPAIRSNYNLIMNLYDELAGGKSVDSTLDPEVKKQIDTMKKDLQKELKGSGLEDMKKDLRKELQKLR